MISNLVTGLLIIPALVHCQDYDEYEVDPNAIEGLPASAADLLDAPYDDGFNCDQQDAGYGQTLIMLEKTIYFAQDIKRRK